MTVHIHPIAARQQSLDAACTRYLHALFTKDANTHEWVAIREAGAAVVAASCELRTARLSEFMRRNQMSTGNTARTIAESVVDVLPTEPPGLSYDQIHTSIGMWSKVTIRHAIRQLIEEGRVHRAGTQSAPLFYRKKEER